MAKLTFGSRFFSLRKPYSEHQLDYEGDCNGHWRYGRFGVFGAVCRRVSSLVGQKRDRRDSRSPHFDQYGPDREGLPLCPSARSTVIYVHSAGESFYPLFSSPIQIHSLSLFLGCIFFFRFLIRRGFLRQIKDLQENDGGEYMCQVLIDIENRISASVPLLVRRPPVISDNSTR